MTDLDEDEIEALRERSLRNIALADEATSDLEERRARSRLGQEPKQWQLPEPEPSALKAESARLKKEFESRLERRLCEFAEIVGEESGTNERKVREHFREEIAQIRTQHEIEVASLKQRVEALEARDDLIPRFLPSSDHDSARH